MQRRDRVAGSSFPKILSSFAAVVHRGRRSRGARRRRSPTAASARARCRCDRGCCRDAQRLRRYPSAAERLLRVDRSFERLGRRRAAIQERARRPCRHKRRVGRASERRAQRSAGASPAALRLLLVGCRRHEESGERREHREPRGRPRHRGPRLLDFHDREASAVRACPCAPRAAARRSSERSAAMRSSRRIVSSCNASRLRARVGDCIAQARQARCEHDVTHQQHRARKPSAVNTRPRLA